MPGQIALTRLFAVPQLLGEALGINTDKRRILAAGVMVSGTHRPNRRARRRMTIDDRARPPAAFSNRPLANVLQRNCPVRQHLWCVRPNLSGLISSNAAVWPGDPAFV